MSRSSVEAEYRGVAKVIAACSWLRQLLDELHYHIQGATIAYCNNVSSVYMARNPVHHRRTKHIELDVHFVREKVALGELRVLQIPSARQFADIFTKGLPSSLFNDFRDSLCVGKPIAATEGGVSELVCTGPACKLVCNCWTRLTRSATLANATHVLALPLARVAAL